MSYEAHLFSIQIKETSMSSSTFRESSPRPPIMAPNLGALGLGPLVARLLAVPVSAPAREGDFHRSPGHPRTSTPRETAAPGSTESTSVGR
jgi:hypothetical protein